MRLFVYEYMTATGTGRNPDSPEHGMYLEGRAMRDALVADFRRLPGAVVLVAPEDDPPADRDGWYIIIAPESDGILLAEANRVLTSGYRLLGCSLEAIALTADKLALAAHWRANNVRTPASTDWLPTLGESFPLVWKPRNGAGSTDTFLIRNHFELTLVKSQCGSRSPIILQEFVPGRAASVAFLCGPRGCVPLLPAFQTLSTDGRFRYLGGELPIPVHLATRAVELACAAVGCVPGLFGYVGVDLVLGDAADGSGDYAIEINPRLTTSYIGLRALADFNLAEAMLHAAEGIELGKLGWRPGRVRFSVDGVIRDTLAASDPH